MTGRRDDTGASLVDLLVAALVLGIVLTTVGLALIGMIRTTSRLEATARASASARAVGDALARGLGQAAEVNEPTVVGTDTYLEARTDAVADGGSPYCTQWRLRAAEGDLAVRTWTVGSADASSWSTLASGVSATQPFTLLAADGGWRVARVGVALELSRTNGATVPVDLVVALVNGSGAGSGIAVDQVCTEVGRA